ncbi:MAG: hypothetical protein ACRC8M_08620 [Cetobacterium sp.]|uniref:hypothetical protein n=1 Tax=Cetobacterium sp. TaxID=2071632 RepID=UPI003F35C220
MRKRICFIYFFILSLVAFSFQMSPIFFEKRIDDGKGFREFYFPNTGNKTIRYKFTPLPGSSHRGDMSKWVELYPKVLTIKPEQVGVLKVFVQAPKGTPEGEYGFLLDSLPIEVLDKSEESSDIKAASAVKIRAAIELVGYVGDIKPQLKLEQSKVYLKDKNVNLDLSFKNLSDKRGVELTAVIKGKNDKVLRRDLGRIGKNGEVKTTIDLKGMSEKDPYEIELIEASTNISILKAKI